ncbi:DUF1499 domain-containing protein [Vibrio sp. RC586]|uniref:DUF1499 domain-containing protein n=1 Tax=Vibrio sp. RC586 TaxID=675815 RepID=UPI000A0121D0
MHPSFYAVIAAFSLTACSQGVAPMQDRTAIPCTNKPNCVSTQDERDKFNLAPFILRPGVTIDQVERVALSLSGASTAEKNGQYLRIECTSSVFRFVDDLELSIQQDHLWVRSESRIGYSDFGVNRRRAEELREKLTLSGLLEQP